MKRSSRELKQLARGILQGKYGTFIGATVIMQLIAMAIGFIPLLVFRNNSTSTLIISEVFSLILSLLTSVLSAGMIQLSLNASRNKTYGVGDLFYGFRHHPDRIIVVNLLIMLIAIACMLPTILLAVYATISYPDSTLFVLGILLFALAGLIATFILVLRYSLCITLLLDNLDMGAIESMRTSARLMQGNKGRYFYLSLSFLGMAILGMLSLGIGMLWVQPYQDVTLVQFYREVIGELDGRPVQTDLLVEQSHYTTSYPEL